MGSQSQKIPCLVGSVDLTSLPLNTLEGFVLSRIDGQANLEMLSDLTSLELPQIVEIIDKLISLGAVAWHRQKISLPKASDRAPVPEQVRRAAREAAAASAEPEGARSPPAPEAEDRVTSPAASTDPVGEPSEISDDLEIPPERRKRIDDLYMVLELLDHYQVLGVERDAPRREIRSAYFEASKVFHPDTMFRKRLGPYKAKMEAVFRRLTEAYETLGKKRLRAQYDEVLTAQDRARRRLSDAPSESDEPSTGADAAPDESGSGAPTSPEPAAPKADRALTSPSVVVSSQDRSGSSGQAVVKTETASDDVQEEPPRSPKQSQPSPEAESRRRKLMARRLVNAARVSSRTSGRTVRRAGGEEVPRESDPGMERQQLLRSLATSLSESARRSGDGGLDRLARALKLADRCEREGKLAEAVEAAQRAVNHAPGRDDVRLEYARLSALLAREQAGQNEEEALAHEDAEDWKSAAAAWIRVVEGRPEDSRAARRAAKSLLKSGGDLHRALSLAQRALELQPGHIATFKLLANIYMAANLYLNARRVLQDAANIAPEDHEIRRLIKYLD